MKQETINQSPQSQLEELPENYWYDVATKLYEQSGEIPDPLQIRATAIIRALGLSSGESSSVEFHEGIERTDDEVEKDKIIAQYLTNKEGVFIDKERGIVSTDFRDIYPKGLPEELKNALDPATRAIMEIEYEHAEATRMGHSFDKLKSDRPVHYFRLPGGIDLFLRAYDHDRMWHRNHKDFLRRINKNAYVICIEGFAKVPFGDSMEINWKGREDVGYDLLMREAVIAGFNGLFSEVDARDASKVSMDNTRLGYFPNLPYTFFQKYFEFLEREHPHLANLISYTQKLENLLQDQSTSKTGFRMDILTKATTPRTQYYNQPYMRADGGFSLEPTFLELGQQLFSDALAAIKLHLLAKLMTVGHLPKGPIIDYEGAGHLSSKSFFLRYPGYAMEVVLRCVNELMAGRAEEKNWFLKLFRKGDMKEIYKVFDNPDWMEIVKEIVRLSFKQVENDPSKSIAPGFNQRKLIDYPIDVLQKYNINPETVVPTDEEIKMIREKLERDV